MRFFLVVAAERKKQFCGSLMFQTDPENKHEKESEKFPFHEIFLCFCPINRIMRDINFRFGSLSLSLSFSLLCADKNPQSNLIFSATDSGIFLLFNGGCFQQC
jgi:hypothetical protein